MNKYITRNIGQNTWKIERELGGRNLDRNRKFYIYFCEVFDYFCQQFSSRRKTGHCAISPYKTENFLVRPNLLRH